ncbi:DNA polymerase III subunit delta' C-terminal domain-containing protein [Lachnoanaerobaculum sp. JCM 36186]|uniref:DNA polymerase III subunit delta' n=1 Tax=Lachnoanaerobaculum sanguinis TaxID=3065809 RepID=UPI00275E9DBF|nr:DNA polymerase III subunit delta' [Lachnoanaerobaculum sp. JCM 36186]GMO03037.1 DNA polymerase III subunit delta' C-terminal domain-containing protein [Lachnoanaerobaculum sp. JCM 36186]
MSDFILGNEKIRHHLRESIIKQSISHAYILAGDNGIGKSKIAREFAMELICEKHTGCGECPACRQFLADAYPDFFYMDADGKESIGIDRIRENIVNDVSIRPYHGKVKIYIIDEADKMTVGAQNALLKTIEEPPEYVVILLLVRNMSLLLETIRSRCIKLLLSAVSNDRIKRWLVEKGTSEDLATVVASYSNGAPGIAKAMAESEDFAGMYNQNVEFLKKISEASINDILLFIEELKKRTGGFRDFINFLRLWYRDICILKLTKKIDNLVFIREESIILRLSREYTLKKINSIIDLIDETETRLNSNVSGDTVMELLFIGLRK